ncbi:flippase [Shewanella sp. A25]|nr:flippase [Shewanella shenzhenensis]
MFQLLVKKFLGSVGVQMFGRGLSVIMGVVLARILDPDEFGLYSFILSLVAIAVIPTIAGMPQLLIREVANNHLEKRWGELKGLQRWAISYIMIMSFIVMFVLAIAIRFELIQPDIGNLLWGALLLVPFKGILSRQYAILNGLQYVVLAQLPQVVLPSASALAIIGVLIYIGIQLDANLLIQVQIVSSAIGVLISAYFIYLKTPKEAKFSLADYKVKHWNKALLPFTLLAIISTMNNEIASVFLGFLSNTESVAYFKVAMQAVSLLSLGLVAINSVIGPKIARYYRQGNIEETQELLTKSVRLGALTSIPFAMFLIFFGDWIVTLLFGEVYLPSAKIITILCIGQIVNVVMGSVGLVLQMTGNERCALKSLAISFVVTMVLLLILIPMYSYIGAAYSVAISMVVWNVLMFLDVRKTTGLTTVLK